MTSIIEPSITSTNLHEASRQWFRRPDDERFLTLEDLEQSVATRKSQSWTQAYPLSHARMLTDPEDNSLKVAIERGFGREEVILDPTHHGFNQLSQMAGAPSSYLRTLPDELAAINLQWGLEHSEKSKGTGLFLAQTNGSSHLRAITSTSYGRIWDLQVVHAVQRVNQDGRWQIPASSYAARQPKRATTLYASDRDVFIFLVDPENPVEVGGETLFRGFYVWNSEVGNATFGLTTFLYRYICDNRIIWGASNIKELTIRHTGGAPERFAHEGRRTLMQYANESTKALVDQIKTAQDRVIDLKRDETVTDWLKTRGFTASIAEASVKAAKAEEGEARTLWQVINGITAHARTIQHTDARVDLERKAGSLMRFASN